MRREAITLVGAMFLSTILMAACDKPGTPDTSKSTPPATATPPAAAPSQTPPPPPVSPSATENKDGTPPVQGQVDPKEPPQKKDFQNTK